MTSAVDFCVAIAGRQPEKALTAIREALRSLAGDGDHEARIAALTAWLGRQPCIRSVQPLAGMQKSLPPRRIIALNAIAGGRPYALELKLALAQTLEAVELQPIELDPR